MTERPRIEVTIAAPIDEVWRALREKDRIRHWHGWDAPGLDDEIDLIYFQGFAEDAQARTLGVQEGDHIVLEPAGEGTKVTLTRAPRGVSPEWDAYYDDITEGWATFLQQLRFHVERQPDAPRRTAFFAGTTAGAPPLVTELGLDEVATRPAGSAYRATLAGQHVGGEVWFRSSHQLGLTVDAWGEGLLVVAFMPPGEQKPDGAAMAVLSTFGLDEAAYAELNERWAAWWGPRYPAPAEPIPGTEA
ncbi:SRPBCC family protein [Jiangella rhizosphaerae]|uniref:SRPBCC domain-containing protein n=1 Tax=Jiangella rhizosphaerae TaxID=2293569 RepID=A0A418KU37_9ACTN|nr:SRPBCC domain-containing protein [Jiangella rhizosphaerae]RIQ30102.1 SRPBCC domain-containing protein [Jiangella rhizosphaerae]